MSLFDRQLAFCAEIAAEDDTLAPSSPGMDIYRNAYRGRLLGALETSFERTRRWVGEEAFTAAACHFILIQPPSSWTLDAYGAEFPEMLASLFSHDPDVAELAWLEWHMQRAFAAPDLPELDPAALARSGYGDADWANMRFTMAAGFAARSVSTDCVQLWKAIGDEGAAPSHAVKVSRTAVLVWRSALSPRFRLTSIEELKTLEAIAGGARFASVAEDADTVRLGKWLSQWLQEGLFSCAAPGVQ